MPSPSKFLDTSGLTLYDQNIKDYIDDIVENNISPAIDAKANDTVFGPSGTGHSKGLVPDPGSTQGSTKFLREDSSWAVPALDPSSMTTVTGSVTLSGAAQANWTQTDSSADDYIKNKPTIPTAASSISSGQTGYATGAQVYNYAYNLPSGGIPETDLASAVTTKLNDVNGRIFYGTCSTKKSTIAKVATLIDSTGFSLTTGTIVAIKFTYASAAGTAEAPMTLSVNNTTAAPIMQYGTTPASSGTTTSGWPTGAVVVFVYDGTYWVRSFFSNTTYSAMTQADADAGTATNSRTITAAVLATTIGNRIVGKEDTSNKSTTISSSSTDTQYPSALAVKTYVDAHGFDPSSMSTASGTVTMTNAENLSNKVTSLSSASTDTQYPSAKCVYNLVGNVETLLAAL